MGLPGGVFGRLGEVLGRPKLVPGRTQIQNNGGVHFEDDFGPSWDVLGSSWRPIGRGAVFLPARVSPPVETRTGRTNPAERASGENRTGGNPGPVVKP